MPSLPDDMILDLTDIVERGAVPDAAGKKAKQTDGLDDIMSAGNQDAGELDDILSRLNEHTDPGHVVDPDETLTMPGMDDMDALLNQIDLPPSGTPAEKPIAANAKATAGANADKALNAVLDKVGAEAQSPAQLDDLLDSLLTDQQKGAPPVEVEDLNHLLDSLLDDSPAPNKAAAQTPDLDLPETGTEDSHPEPAPQPQAAAQDAEEHIARLDGLDLEELDTMLPLETSNTRAEEPQEPMDSIPGHLEDAAETIAEHTPEEINAPQEPEIAAGSGDIVAADADEALQDLMPFTALQEAVAENEETGLELIVDQLSSDMNDMAGNLGDLRAELEMLRARLDSVGPTPELPPLPDFTAFEERLLQCESGLGMLATKINRIESGLCPEVESTPVDSAINEQLAADLATIDDRLIRLESAAELQEARQEARQESPDPEALLESLRPIIEKAAAAAAAEIIREEIQALMADE